MFPLHRNQSVICSANELTRFYMMGTLFVKGLKVDEALVEISIDEVNLFEKNRQYAILSSDYFTPTTTC